MRLRARSLDEGQPVRLKASAGVMKTVQMGHHLDHLEPERTSGLLPAHPSKGLNRAAMD